MTYDDSDDSDEGDGGALTDDGYFPSRSGALTLDHSVMVPMHFLDPGERMRLQPIYLNGLVPPLPSASTCRDVGARVRSVIEQWGGSERVALVASGSFSLEVGGLASTTTVSRGCPIRNGPLT